MGLLCGGVCTCMFGSGRSCSHSQTPLSLWKIEAAMAEPVSVVLTSGLSPKNSPINIPSRVRPEMLGKIMLR